ncbi:hypothetical protein Bcav_1871 [Beutenbergia cavernae DSM 12333]|uniref:Uncharacterized protein n=1 Tax=Beutenbergia cavernae (strain ATCC BAA-8 / DSM 12333 / CCUG 43141 / JCM 11478 / NBRC 16432 / NCIMB 13614 / HKI 0122) TaxID=471853 RepID=C5C4Z9_BEUC1|nr:YesL family protein [Beutenbergia cavernae]ACQ80127.1 hypothetical protein Bcav_1871 [Beutenbergia cavernae DSM 12333]
MTSRSPDGAGPWSRVVDLLAGFWRAVGINALWLVASLPIVTIGPATVALMAMARDDVMGRPRPAARAFVAYVRENVAVGLALSTMTLGAVGSFALLWRLDPAGGTTATRVLQVVSLVGLIAVAPVIAHGYALAAHTQQGVRGVYRASVIMAFARPGETVLALAVVAALVLLSWYWPFSVLLAGYVGSRAIFTTFRRTFAALQDPKGASDDAPADARS